MQTYPRKLLQMTKVSGKQSNYCLKKLHLPERINLTEEENNCLLTNCKEVEKELNNLFANAVKISIS